MLLHRETPVAYFAPIIGGRDQTTYLLDAIRLDNGLDSANRQPEEAHLYLAEINGARGGFRSI
jgi:hypothetical protein